MGRNVRISRGGFAAVIALAAGAATLIAFSPIAGGDTSTGPGPTVLSAVPSGSTPTTAPSSASAQAIAAAALAKVPAAPRPLVLHYQAAPRVASASRTCTAHLIRASLSAYGPYQSGSSMQLIVKLTASRACIVSGYPVLRFSMSPGHGITPHILPGGTAGASNPVSGVTIGPSTSGSFLIQFASQGCSQDAHLSVSFLSIAGLVTVARSPVLLSSWSACAVINESPVVQGASINRYA
jgi:hypothetical protein